MFDWDDHNTDHIAGHDLEPEDVEEALLDPRRIGLPAYNVGYERRWAALGAVEGRILFVVFTRRKELVRVVTARNATEREKRRYRSRGK